MQIERNHKFAAFFLSRCWLEHRLPNHIDLGGGIYAGRKLDVDVGHWAGWLGSIAAREFREDGLLVYISAAAQRPEDYDDENQALGLRINDLFYGLVLQGVPQFMRGSIIHGANVDGELGFRHHSALREVQVTFESPPFAVGVAELTHAVRLARRLREMQRPGELKWARLLRSVRVLLKANGESNAHGERLHQFVRSVEGLIKPRIGGSARDFAHRGQTFAIANEETRQALFALFIIRSYVEHLHDARDAVEGTERERIETLNRRTRQADALSRYAIRRVLEQDHLYEMFATESGIDGFWARLDGERVSIWGDRIDITAIR
jgi:hypothetical protein